MMSAPERTADSGPQTAEDGGAEDGGKRAADGERQAAPEPTVEKEREAVEADLDALLEETQRERDEYLELAQRARADFDNYRKRAARETEEAERRGRVKLAEALLPVIDNLERALLAADSGDALAEGVALVHRELQAALGRAGVSSYDPAGARFDPVWHEALSTRAGDGTEPGVVLETVDKGYKLDEQVLRAARVIVSE